MDALRPLWDAERPGLHSHGERGNDHRSRRDTGTIKRPGQRFCRVSSSTLTLVIDS